MIALTLADVAAATGGTVHGCPDPESVVVDGPVVTDSRQCAPGSLYVARVGEHADGHDYAPAAAAAGAVAVLGSRPLDGIATVVVDDVQTAFGRVAHAVLAARRDAGGLDVVAVTGSSGKTSTKDLLEHVLATAGETIAPVESFNGEIGVPLTVCRVTPSTRFLVLEMGARGLGHLRYLTDIARPDVAAVLNVGTAHVGEFGSRANIARAKGELVEALDPSGLAVLNADDPLVAAMAQRTAAPVVLVGRSPDAHVRAVDVELGADGCARFTLVAPTGRTAVRLGLVGEHHVGNALSVAAVALHLGLGLDDVVAALATARPVSRWRMEVTERPDDVTVVNDAYNANPDSMRAAIAALAHLGSSGRRTWAVLGSMLELGDDSTDEHAAVGRAVAEAGIDRLVVVGQAARPIADGAADGATVTWVPDTAAAAALLADLAPGDVVLFKSSRDAGLRWLGDDIAGRGRPPAPGTQTPAPTASEKLA